MNPSINTSGLVAVCVGGATSAVTLVAGIGVPKQYWWVAAAVGAAIGLVGWLIPQHVYHAAPPAPPVQQPAVQPVVISPPAAPPVVVANVTETSNTPQEGV